jgi:hypothetical protein
MSWVPLQIISMLLLTIFLPISHYFCNEVTSTIRIPFIAIVEGAYLKYPSWFPWWLGVPIFVWYVFMHVLGQ